jgi:hypothetical protein
LSNFNEDQYVRVQSTGKFGIVQRVDPKDKTPDGRNVLLASPNRGESMFYAPEEDLAIVDRVMLVNLIEQLTNTVERLPFTILGDMAGVLTYDMPLKGVEKGKVVIVASSGDAVEVLDLNWTPGAPVKNNVKVGLGEDEYWIDADQLVPSTEENIREAIRIKQKSLWTLRSLAANLGQEPALAEEEGLRHVGLHVSGTGEIMDILMYESYEEARDNLLDTVESATGFHPKRGETLSMWRLDDSGSATQMPLPLDEEFLTHAARYHNTQVPTVNRMVHYHAYGTPGGEYKSVPRAAVITDVIDPDLVGLAILNPTGQFFNPRVPYSAEPKPGHWSWPPRA